MLQKGVFELQKYFLPVPLLIRTIGFIAMNCIKLIVRIAAVQTEHFPGGKQDERSSKAERAVPQDDRGCAISDHGREALRSDHRV